MAICTMTSKGQVTLPMEVRRRLGLKRGSRVDFSFDGEQTVVRPAQTGENPFLKYVGSIPEMGTQEDVIAWVREMRDDEDAPR
jgi:antitoxin PrlF